MGIQLRQTQYAQYNGHTFNQTVSTKRIQITPEPSQDGRTVLYNRWRFTLTFEIATTIGTTDPLVQAAVACLSHPGGVFIYRGRGLGNPDINTGTIRDLKYGPMPRDITLEPIGTGNAVRITWSVEFTAPNCPGANNPFGILELSYRVSHVRDDAGYTSRRTSGYLTIPLNRTAPGSRQVEVTADEYRDQVVTPIPYGFQRKGYQFDTSPDLTRLDFSWVDDEQPVPLPEGIVEATFSDEVTSATGLVKWTGTMSGSYRMARGYNWLAAAQAYFEMISAILADRNDRLGSLKAARPRGRQTVPAGKGRLDNKAVPSTIVPLSFRAANPNRYGRPAANFTLTYSFACPLSQLLNATGMYLPFTHPYGLWLASMQDLNNPYGGANLVWAAQDDPGIVDACGIPGELRGGGGWVPPPLPNPTQPGTSTGGTYPPTEAPVDRYVNDLISGTFSKPQQSDSWMYYENSIFLEANTGVLHVKRLPDKVPNPSNGVFAENGVVPPSGDATALNDFRQFAPPWFTPNVGGNLVNIPVQKGIMRRVEESCVVYLTGKAYRFGYPISPPRLLTINGIPCVPQCRPDRGEGFGQGVWANSVQTVNYAWWNLRYVLTAVPPAPFPVPPSPFDKP